MGDAVRQCQQDEHASTAEEERRRHRAGHGEHPFVPSCAIAAAATTAPAAAMPHASRTRWCRWPALPPYVMPMAGAQCLTPTRPSPASCAAGTTRAVGTRGAQDRSRSRRVTIEASTPMTTYSSAHRG